MFFPLVSVILQEMFLLFLLIYDPFFLYLYFRIP
jgi:hypothetical protein